MAASVVTAVPLPMQSSYSQNQRRSHKPNGKRKMHLTVNIELTLRERRVKSSIATTVKEFSQNPKENSRWQYTNFPSIRAHFKRICLEGRVKEALAFFSDRNMQGIPADYDTYAYLLQACATAKALTEGKQIHSHILTSGLKPNQFLVTKLINMYVNCGSLEDARQVFDKISKRNLFLWNAVIRGYASQGMYNEVLELYTEMQCAGMKPNRFTFPLVLKACTSKANLQQGKEIHDCIKKSGFEWDPFASTALITMYVKCGLLVCARQLFDKMTQRDVVSWNAMIAGYAQNGNFDEVLKLFDEMQLAGLKPNVITQNVMIAGYSQDGQFDKALELFRQMQRAGGKPNLETWNAMITGYAQNGYRVDALKAFHQLQLAGLKPDSFTFASILPVIANLNVLQHGKQFHSYIIKVGFQSDVFVANALLDMYAKCGSIRNAEQMFDKMSQRDVVTWNAIIGGYAQNGHYNESLKIFIQMQLEGVKPDSFTVASFLPACSHIAALQQGKEIHNFIVRNRFDSSVIVANALVDMYSKCGSLRDAHCVFDSIPQKTVVSWNAIIAGYGMHGYGEDAVMLLSQMEQEAIKPNDITFIAILTACSHAGLVDEGWEQFHRMSQIHGIIPRVEHYTCIVDLLGRAGHLEEANVFIEKMPVEPDAGVWGALLGACRIHRNIELGERVAGHIFELDPKDAGYYVLLSNIYAAASRWADAAKVRTMMTDRGVKKMPGCSWTEVKHKVHAFLMGDQSHPQSEKIYSTLEVLIKQIKAAGYVPDTSFVLYHVEEQEKQHMLYSHSEKLAIAFGLINTCPGTPIQITKNLRVCGDCHTAAKFISNITRREIIVRDLYRFHHFKGGLCSCRDYW